MASTLQQPRLRARGDGRRRPVRGGRRPHRARRRSWPPSACPTGSTDAAALPLFHRIAGQPVIVLGEGEAAEAKRRLVERAGGDVRRRGRAADARLAFVALDDAASCDGGAAAARARPAGQRRRPARAVRLHRCPACSTASRCWSRSAPAAPRPGWPSSCGCGSKRCCRPISGALADALLARARRACARAGPMPADRRRALDAALAQGGPLDPLAPGQPTRSSRGCDEGESPLAGEPVELTSQRRSRRPDAAPGAAARNAPTAILFEPGHGSRDPRSAPAPMPCGCRCRTKGPLPARPRPAAAAPGTSVR